jgi:hypothetical protein
MAVMRTISAFFLASLAFAQLAQRPVLDTAKSPKAALRGVPVGAVKMHDGFWSARQKANVDVSLPTLLLLFEEKGVIDDFRRVSGRKDAARRGPLYTDSDVYKWLEAVGFVLQSGDHPELRKKAEAVIDEIVAAQEENGYINTFYTKENREQRHKNMRGGHEMYCLGHMLQGGIAWFRATADRKLLDSSIKMVEYVLREFGPDKQPLYEGHPEIELALVELYRLSGDKRYLDLAGYFLEGDPRNHARMTPRDFVYLFTGKPFLERTKLEGHAVRAMYACSGATDYYLETGEARYKKVLDSLWDDMVRRKMYITGGVGSRASGEAFGEPYELPNQQAYTESCAAIGTMFWNWRMMHAEPDSKYMDTFERALYNGANSGLSLKGNLYCYRNPLEHVGNPEDKIRNPWYDTTCCPPNLQRILASLPGYFYSTSSEGLWVHLFDNNTLRWKLEDGSAVGLTQTTRYPWEGRVEISLTQAPGKEFSLFVRKPFWAGAARVEVAGQAAKPDVRNGYWSIRRAWKPGDRVVVDLGVTERLTISNPRVRENLGKVAVERGPLLYCMEELDQPQGASLFDWILDLSGGNHFASEWKADMLGGVTVVRHRALRPESPNAAEALYQPFGGTKKLRAGEVMLIPYYPKSGSSRVPMRAAQADRRIVFGASRGK